MLTFAKLSLGLGLLMGVASLFFGVWCVLRRQLQIASGLLALSSLALIAYTITGLPYGKGIGLSADFFRRADSLELAFSAMVALPAALALSDPRTLQATRLVTTVAYAGYILACVTDLLDWTYLATSWNPGIGVVYCIGIAWSSAQYDMEGHYGIVAALIVCGSLVLSGVHYFSNRRQAENSALLAALLLASSYLTRGWIGF